MEMSYSREKYRMDTLFERIQLFKAMQRLPYKQAIESMMPARDASGNRMNSNRMQRIKTWQQKGLFPVSERDIEEAKQWGWITDEDLVERKDNSDEIGAYMRRNFGKPLTEPVCSYKKHLGARLPLEVAEQLRELPGTMSSHVLKAVSLYIDAYKEISS